MHRFSCRRPKPPPLDAYFDLRLIYKLLASYSDPDTFKDDLTRANLRSLFRDHTPASRGAMRYNWDDVAQRKVLMTQVLNAMTRLANNEMDTYFAKMAEKYHLAAVSDAKAANVEASAVGGGAGASAMHMEERNLLFTYDDARNAAKELILQLCDNTAFAKLNAKDWDIIKEHLDRLKDRAAALPGGENMLLLISDFISLSHERRKHACGVERNHLEMDEVALRVWYVDRIDTLTDKIRTLRPDLWHVFGDSFQELLVHVRELPKWTREQKGNVLMYQSTARIVNSRFPPSPDETYSNGIVTLYENMRMLPPIPGNDYAGSSPEVHAPRAASAAPPRLSKPVMVDASTQVRPRDAHHRQKSSGAHDTPSPPSHPSDVSPTPTPQPAAASSPPRTASPEHMHAASASSSHTEPSGSARSAGSIPLATSSVVAAAAAE